ncbi:uncharacterized protein LOC109456786 [Rhinolophus sinicus]|uniref:uncharacterized protein LOC109456786 n=1 Tax=Rhinolophus sinicus TaxID=89399 RepID=UPI003D793176
METRRKPQLLVHLTLFSVLFSQMLAWPLLETPFLKKPFEGANELDPALLTPDTDILPNAFAGNDRNARHAEEILTSEYKRLLGPLPAKRHVESFIGKRDSDDNSEDNEIIPPSDANSSEELALKRLFDSFGIRYLRVGLWAEGTASSNEKGSWHIWTARSAVRPEPCALERAEQEMSSAIAIICESVFYSFPLPHSGTHRLVTAGPSHLAPEQGLEYGGNSEEHRVERAPACIRAESVDARMQKALGGCQKDWCDMWTLSPLMMLPMLCQAEPDQTYWAYVPDPPILHPAVWDGPEIPVYVNDTQALGLPSDGHIKQQLEKNFTYNGIGTGLPICIANNRSTSGCLCSSPVTMHINDSLVGWTVCLNMLGDWSGGRRINLPIPPSHPSCNKRLKLNIETVPWRDYPGNDPVRYDIPGTGRYIINWSRSNQSRWD